MSENEELLVGKLEGVANLLRGMSMDPAIPKETRDFMMKAATEIDKVTEKFTEEK